MIRMLQRLTFLTIATSIYYLLHSLDYDLASIAVRLVVLAASVLIIVKADAVQKSERAT